MEGGEKRKKKRILSSVNPNRLANCFFFSFFFCCINCKKKTVLFLFFSCLQLVLNIKHFFFFFFAIYTGLIKFSFQLSFKLDQTIKNWLPSLLLLLVVVAFFFPIILYRWKYCLILKCYTVIWTTLKQNLLIGVITATEWKWFGHK